jgi:hypothetical protein
MSRAQQTSTVEQNTGGAVAPWTAGKNAAANGGMDWWQRGTSFSITSSSAYTADRWYVSATPATTISQQTSGAPSNFKYFTRIQRNSGNAVANYIQVFHSLETNESLRFAGQIATVSFYARAGANYSAASNALGVQIRQGTGTDENAISYTSGTNAVNTSVTLTTSWQRFTVTGSVSSSATEVGLNFYFSTVGTAGAADYYDITGVQLELGSVATPFSRAGGTLQGELALCQRYAYQLTGANGAGGTSEMIALGTYYNSSIFRAPIRFPVPMRKAPNYTSANAANYFALLGVGATVTYSTTTLDFATPNAANINVSTSGGTAGQSVWLQTNSGTSFILFDAEL